MRINIALRNIFRNKRRTALNILMIAGGVTSIVLFRGFAHYLITNLRNVAIKNQYGHLQVATEAYWKNTAPHSKASLLPDSQSVIAEIKKNPEVTYASGRISFFGLLSTPDRSVSAQGVSFDPVAEENTLATFYIVEGKPIDFAKPFQVIVGSGLAQQLNVHPGDSLTVLTYTYDGVINALDLEVAGLFQTAVAEFDDNAFVIALATAQTLLNTTQAEKIVVGLKDTDNTDSVRDRMQSILKDGSLQIKTWHDLARLYNQVFSFYRVQNRVIEIIIVSLVLLGIMNTVGMSVYERTGEIGTLRALGDTEARVIVQFVLEGIMLGMIGAIAGVACAIVASRWIDAMRIPVVIPNASLPIHIVIDLYWESFRDAIALTLTASALAALVPAIHASRIQIVEALKRNI